MCLSAAAPRVWPPQNRHCLDGQWTLSPPPTLLKTCLARWASGLIPPEAWPHLGHGPVEFPFMTFVWPRDGHPRPLLSDFIIWKFPPYRLNYWRSNRLQLPHSNCGLREIFHTGSPRVFSLCVYALHDNDPLGWPPYGLIHYTITAAMPPLSPSTLRFPPVFPPGMLSGYSARTALTRCSRSVS